MARLKKIHLSIDWDYFFPDLIKYDYGHKESLFFMEQVWYMRAHSRISELGGDPRESLLPKGHLDFWNKLAEINLVPKNLWVHESHAYGAEIAIATECDIIAVFDQHMDIYQGMKGAIDCENWLRRTLDAFKDDNRKTPHTFIIMDDDARRLEIPKEYPITVTNLQAFQAFIKATPSRAVMSFVCRSGSWCPPWSDKEFFEFLNDSGASWMEWKDGLYSRTWDPERAEITQIAIDKMNKLI